MKQVKIGLDESHINFRAQFKHLGFRDKSEMVRFALERYLTEITEQRLRESALLYAQIYEEDVETREWTEADTSEWPA